MTHIDLDTMVLAKGGHDTRLDGVCLLEAVAWQAGEDHTDRPVCVSPVLAAFGRSLNDVLPDAKRQELVPLVPLLPGTAGDGHDETRGYMALDWLIRGWTPAWFSLAGLTADAQALRDLRRIVDMAAAKSAAPVVQQASQKAFAAGDGPGDAAWADVWADVWDDSAGAAAMAVARHVAWAGVWHVARESARAVAMAVARAVARATLAPTVASLQDSAISLYQAMINAEVAS
jgi:hypothetical protein